MAIYTRKGDSGQTNLFKKSKGKFVRVSKSSQTIIAIGAIDEANSILGLAASMVKSKAQAKIVKDIQSDLFRIGSTLAGSQLSFPKSKIKQLERKIDKLEGHLPVLGNFILPGGSLPGAVLHLARATIRRAERELVKLSQEENVNPTTLAYINRLSDFVFMLARLVNSSLGVKEEIWKGKGW